MVAARVAETEEGRGMGVLSPRHVAERNESSDEAESDPADDDADRGRTLELYEMSEEERESEPERVREVKDDPRVCT